VDLYELTTEAVCDARITEIVDDMAKKIDTGKIHLLMSFLCCESV